ncbi:hypothetical protein MKW92_047421 [Papaver armeniacum]|nr:hypothetical protein MKW92_047421 [Papaver armeniacum]
MKVHNNGISANSGEGERKLINSELWHACAGPLVSLPPVGSLVVYFPQGHSEQVAASMQKDTDSIPGYPSLPSKLICVLHNVTLHADAETDEVYAQMTLQPYDKEALLASDMGLKQSKQPSEFFCKTLTASDTSTHGGFSLVARDLHDVAWTFRHIYRGMPTKKALADDGLGVCLLAQKRLFAGDSVLFIRYPNENSKLLLGIRRANRQQPALSSSVISSDSMHIGILAAAAHAAASNSPFNIFYNPRICSSVSKYNKAMYTQVSLGMRFRMMFETEESGARRYMGTITGISDLDPVRWKSSQWRNLQVGWDESAAGERSSRVSIWDIEPAVTPFYICPPPFFRPKFSNHPGIKDPQNPMFPGLSLVQWMSMQQQNPQLSASQFPPMISSSSTANIQHTIPTKLPQYQPKIPLLLPSLPQDVQFQRQLEQQQSLSQRQQQQQQHNAHLQPLPMSQHELQLQLLQKLQQQQQLLSQVSPRVQPQVSQQQQIHQQSQQLQQQLPLAAATTWNQQQHFSTNHLQGQQKPTAQIRAHSGLTDGDAPSCSTSPSTNNCQVSGSSFLNRSHPGSGTFTGGYELQSKSDVKIKHELPSMKEPEHLGYRGGATTDPVEASSTATSYCLDGGSLPTNFSMPNYCLDGDVQADTPNNLLFGVNIDGLTPEALMSRRFDRDINCSNQFSVFGVTDMSLKPVCSGDGPVNDNGVLNRGLWANQTPQQRMLDAHKVQKRGSVGRSIDITRYKEYEELRYDLARMFGIEGQLEESQTSEWKLVYVDHENDILLVGDDPWGGVCELCSEYQILSSAEVQQLSLDEILEVCQLPPKPAVGLAGNAWKGQVR